MIAMMLLHTYIIFHAQLIVIHQSIQHDTKEMKLNIT